MPVALRPFLTEITLTAAYHSSPQSNFHRYGYQAVQQFL